MQLGIELLQANRASDCMSVFGEVPFDELPLEALHPYAIAAFRAGQLAEADRAIDRLALAGVLPSWALAVSADIALIRADPEQAALRLSELERRGEATPRARLALARCLVELGREAEALEQVETAVLGSPSPLERAQAAAYLHELGRTREAITQCYLAFRSDRGNPKIQRVLATLVFTAGIELPKPDAVDVGTWVRLRKEDGAVREHSIFAEPPIDAYSGDMSAEDAAQEILGKHVGETVERAAGHWSGQRWTVEEILPVEVAAARKIIQTFADNFPGESFFVVPVSITGGEGMVDWAQLIAALGEQQRDAKQTLAMYHEKVLPLEFVTSFLPTSLPEVMRAAEFDQVVAPLLVEWSDGPSQEASRAAAAKAGTLIFTRSALVTAQRLGLLDVIGDRYLVVVPTSLIWQLRTEVAEARDVAAKGKPTLTLAAYGPHIEEVKPGDPLLTDALGRAEAALAWVETNAKREPRPYASIGETGSDREGYRTSLGPPSFDAVSLAEEGIGVLYADDLGLRRVSITRPGRPDSVSTITLLDALVARGVLGDQEAAGHLGDLVLAGYAFVLPTDGLLQEGLKRMPALGRDGLAKLFGPLGGPLVSAPEAAALAARAIRAAAVAPISTVGVGVVAEAAVRAMARRWNVVAAARLVQQHAERELVLLHPQYVQAVTEACRHLAAEATRGPRPR